MIHYNMRYRGAYEYDKFILNIMQYSNMINNFLNDLDDTEAFNTLKALDKEVQYLFDLYTQPNGIGENIYKELILFKEGYNDTYYELSRVE